MRLAADSVPGPNDHSSLAVLSHARRSPSARHPPLRFVSSHVTKPRKARSTRLTGALSELIGRTNQRSDETGKNRFRSATGASWSHGVWCARHDTNAEGSTVAHYRVARLGRPRNSATRASEARRQKLMSVPMTPSGSKTSVAFSRFRYSVTQHSLQHVCPWRM